MADLYAIGYDVKDINGIRGLSLGNVGAPLDIITTSVKEQPLEAILEFEAANDTEIWIYKVVPYRKAVFADAQ